MFCAAAAYWDEGDSGFSSTGRAGHRGANPFALSSVVRTHTELVKHGVPAEPYVWEGMGHAYFMNPEFPESRERYDVTVKFFDKHLGKE